MRGLLFRAIKRNYETIKAATTFKDNPCSLERKKTFNISRLKSFEGQQTLMRQSDKVCELALKASYQVALRVAQTKQPYVIAESLILPTASDMCKTMFGEKTEKHPNAKLPKADYFALQLDESTDVSNDAQLLAFCDLSTKMRCRRNFDSVSSCLEVKKKFRDFQSDRQFFP